MHSKPNLHIYLKIFKIYLVNLIDIMMKSWLERQKCRQLSFTFLDISLKTRCQTFTVPLYYTYIKDLTFRAACDIIFQDISGRGGKASADSKEKMEEISQ